MLGTVRVSKRPPRNDRVLRLATSGAVQKIDLTASNPVMSGIGEITIRAITSDIQLYFCTTAASAGNTIGLDGTTAQQMGITIPAGSQDTFELLGTDQVAILISRAAGFVEFWRSGQERIDQR